MSLRQTGMDFCFDTGGGPATMWQAPLDTDLDGDGLLDAIRLDLDHDGLLDDALADLDGDGTADQAVLDFDGATPQYFIDDGSGTWALSVDRAGQLRWFGLDSVEQSPAGTVDFDGDGVQDDALVDSDGDGLADRVLCADDAGVTGYVDTDGDGLWDVTLVDADGDGAADSAAGL